MATNLDKLSRINRRIINSLSDINIKTIQYWDLNENSILAMVKIWQLRYEIFVIFYKSPVSVCDYIRDLRYHRSISISYFFIKSCGKLFYQRRDLKKKILKNLDYGKKQNVTTCLVPRFGRVQPKIVRDPFWGLKFREYLLFPMCKAFIF